MVTSFSKSLFVIFWQSLNVILTRPLFFRIIFKHIYFFSSRLYLIEIFQFTISFDFILWPTASLLVRSGEKIDSIRLHCLGLAFSAYRWNSWRFYGSDGIAAIWVFVHPAQSMNVGWHLNETKVGVSLRLAVNHFTVEEFRGDVKSSEIRRESCETWASTMDTSLRQSYITSKDRTGHLLFITKRPKFVGIQKQKERAGRNRG